MRANHMTGRSASLTCKNKWISNVNTRFAKTVWVLCAKRSCWEAYLVYFFPLFLFLGRNPTARVLSAMIVPVPLPLFTPQTLGRSRVDLPAAAAVFEQAPIFNCGEIIMSYELQKQKMGSKKEFFLSRQTDIFLSFLKHEKIENTDTCKKKTWMTRMACEGGVGPWGSDKRRWTWFSRSWKSFIFISRTTIRWENNKHAPFDAFFFPLSNENCNHLTPREQRRDKVDFFNVQKEQGIKMHKFPALNLNKNANETLWVLMMHTHALFAIFFYFPGQDERQVSPHWRCQRLFFDASGRRESSWRSKALKRRLIKALISRSCFCRPAR